MNFRSLNSMHILRAAWPALFLVVLGGCAGGPFQIGGDAGAEATLYIFRAPGGMPGRYPKEVLIDGKSLGSLVNGGYFRVRLSPGNHVISTPSANKAKLELRAEKGASYYISQEVIPANPPYILINRVGEKFGKPYVEHSRRLY